MYPIKKSGSLFCLSHFPWIKDYPGAPKTEVTVSWTEDALCFHFCSYEQNLRAVQTEHNSPVCQDSCVEIFMQYAPETDPRYINIEINPNCAVYAALRYDRARSTMIPPEEIQRLDVRVQAHKDRWEVDCRIPADWIRRWIPTYRHEAGAILRGNLYKCGDLTDHPHYGAFADIPLPSPDFHRPEYFTAFRLTEE